MRMQLIKASDKGINYACAKYIMIFNILDDSAGQVLCSYLPSANAISELVSQSDLEKEKNKEKHFQFFFQNQILECSLDMYSYKLWVQRKLLLSFSYKTKI